MRNIGYTRVSSPGQDAQDQFETMLSLGVQDRDIFSDCNSGSKSASQWPGLRKLFDQAQPGDTVTVVRLDRLGRSVIDALMTVRRLKTRGIEVRSLAEDIDSRTEHGERILVILDQLVGYEQYLTVERARAGLSESQRRGTRFGRPPVDPAEIARKLSLAAEARSQGASAEEAARMVGWSRPTFYRHQREAEFRLRALADEAD